MFSPKKKLNNRGFGHILILLVIVLAGISTVGYYVYKHSLSSSYNTYTELTTIVDNGINFSEKACIASQSGTAPNYVDTVTAVISVNKQAGPKTELTSNGKLVAGSGYNPLAFYSINGTAPITEDNWVTGSISTIKFNLVPSLPSSSFNLGVEATLGSSTPIPGSSQSISSLSLCSAPAKTSLTTQSLKPYIIPVIKTTTSGPITTTTTVTTNPITKKTTTTVTTTNSVTKKTTTTTIITPTTPTTPTIPTTYAPTISLSAAPTSLTSGSTSALTWSSTNATSCTASGAWSGSKATSGSTVTSSLTSTSSYNLSCSGAGGSTLATVIVTVTAPTGGGLSSPAAVLGAYTGFEGISGTIGVGTMLGHSLNFVTDFLDFTDSTNGWTSTGNGITNPYYISNWTTLQSQNGTHFRLVWGLPLLPNHSLDPVTGTTTTCPSTTCWAEGANGDFNSYFKTVAQTMVNDGQANSIIRLGWEFNVPSDGGGYPWSVKNSAGTAFATTAQYIAYWRNVVTTMRSVSGQQFVFVWNPNFGGQETDLASWYPGDAYVDAVGFDLYDNSWYTASSHTGQSNWNYFLTAPEGLNWLDSFNSSHNKPYAFPEWGMGWTNCSNGSSNAGQTCPAGSSYDGEVSGGDDVYFVSQMANYIKTHSFIEAGVWDSGTGAFPNSTVDPNATTEFINDFK